MTGSSDQDLDQDYSRAGFGGGLGLGQKPALILIDFMMAYFEKDAPLYAGVEKELGQAVTLLSAARQAGIPVIHTKVEYSEDNQAAIFRKKIPALNALTPGSKLSKIHNSVLPSGKESILTKHYASAFFGTNLVDKLRAGGCDSLFICGLTTSGCVRATALDALQNEFIPVVIEDACGDRDDRVHESNIFDLKAKYAEIIDTKTGLAHFKKLAS